MFNVPKPVTFIQAEYSFNVLTYNTLSYMRREFHEKRFDDYAEHITIHTPIHYWDYSAHEMLVLATLTGRFDIAAT